MSTLRRTLAPLTKHAWKFVEDEAISALKAHLTNRRVVDVSEPKGFDFSAVNLGTLEPTEEAGGVQYGLRRVLPLVEVRVPIELDIWELDNLTRGATNVDIRAVSDAALKLAAFEERAVYYGFEAGGITGLASDAEPQELGDAATRFSDIVARALQTLGDRGVSGPFALVLGPNPYRALMAAQSTDPPRRQIAQLLDGPIIQARVVEGGFLLSLRGGDFELTLGQDASIGYDWHDRIKAHLYLTESFTFRTLASEAVVPFSYLGKV